MSTVTNNFLIVITLSFVLFAASCKKTISTKPEKIGEINDIGYIISSEQMNNRFFDNGIYYFIPASKVDSIKPMINFREDNFKSAYGFVLYSSYYTRLINAMSTDLIFYELDLSQNDPNRLNIEFRRCLPVKIKFDYDLLNLSNNLQKDSIMVNDGKRLHFTYKMVGNIKIRALEILEPKDDDLSGNESISLKRTSGLFGIVKNKQ